MANLYFEAQLDADQLKRELRDTRNRMNRFTKDVQANGAQMDSTFKRVGAAMAGYFSITAAKGFLDQVIQVRGEFQQLDIALQTMLGSKSKADKMMSEVVELAAKTPFSLTELGQGAKRLLAFQEPTDRVGDSLRRLGDLAAGASVPVTDLIQAYGKVSAKGKMQAEELNQFAERGIPIIAELAKVVGVTDKEIYKMAEQGKIGFEELRAAIMNMTSEGGQFFNLMEKQSGSLTGQISNLGDAWDRMLNEIGQNNEGFIYAGIDGLKSLVENYETIIDVLQVVVTTFGAYKAAVLTAWMAQKAMALGQTIRSLQLMTKGINSATRAQVAFNTAAKMNPWGLLAAGIAATVTLISVFNEKAKSTEDIISDLDSATGEYSDNAQGLSELADEFETLKGKTERTKDENDRLNTVMEQLAQSVPTAAKEFDEYGRIIDLNTGKVKEFSEEQKRAVEIQLESTISQGRSNIEQINKDIESLQKTYIGGKEREAWYKGAFLDEASEEEIAEAATEANKLYLEREKLIQRIAEAEKTLQEIKKEEVKEEEVVRFSLKDFEKQLSEQKKAYENYNSALRSARDEDKEAIKGYYTDLLSQGEDYEQYLIKQLEAFRNNVQAKVAIYQAATDENIDLSGKGTPTKLKGKGVSSVGDVPAPDSTDLANMDAYIQKWEETGRALQSAMDLQRMDEMGEKLISGAYNLQDIAGAVGQIDAELGAAMGGIADAVGQVGNISKMAASGDMMGVATAGLNGALQVTGMLVNSAKERQAAEEAFYRSIRQQQQDYNLALNEQLKLQTELSEGIFLTDYSGRMGDAMSSLSDATKEYYKLEGDLAEGQAKVGQRNAVDWGNVGTGAAGGAAAGAAIGSIVPVIGTAIGGVVGGVAGAIGGLFGGKKKKDTFSSLLQEYPELLDKTKEGADRFNDALAETLIKNETVKGDTKETLENLIAWKDAAKAAEEQIAQISKDLVGTMGDDLKNSLVSAFEEGENAAHSFGDSVEKILEDMIAGQAMQAVFGNLFDQFEKDFADAYTSDGYKGAMPLMSDMMEDAIGLQDDFNKFIEEAKKKGDSQGLSLFDGGASEDPLTGAIKGVSEETASLIGGQMNAIRINQAESLRIMNESVRYQAQIAVNTSNNVHLVRLENIERILSSFKSNNNSDPLKAKGL
jgi:tape measure domain-containing protein